MRPVRKPKNALAAWLVEQRRQRRWRVEDVAERVDVVASTVRAWESGRGISDDNLDALERLFGVESPAHVEQPSADSALVAELRRHTEATLENSALLRDLISGLVRPAVPTLELEGPPADDVQRFLADRGVPFRWAPQRTPERRAPRSGPPTAPAAPRSGAAAPGASRPARARTQTDPS